MKNILHRIFVCAFFFVAMMTASAQKTAITFSPFNVAFYANTSFLTQGFMGIGIERNVGTYIALKLEINRGFQILYHISNGKILGITEGNEHTREYTDSLGEYNEFSYHWTVPSFDINYQSKFFFRGNDQTGAYMSMGIGIRSVKYIFHTGPLDKYSYDSQSVPHDLQLKDGYSENLVVVPLILRVGARGRIQGFFPDFSFGMGFNIAHGKTIEDKTITRTWDLSVPSLSGFTVTGGISFGIGW
jgi:hypothetical protein